MMQLDARTLALAQQQLQLQQQLHGQSTATPSFMQTDAGKPNATGATGVMPLSKATKRSLDESSQAGDHRKSIKAEVSSNSVMHGLFRVRLCDDQTLALFFFQSNVVVVCRM
jgi:hypothetical protein